MPDPTAHAADMTSPATIKPNEMPAFWWFNPWRAAIQQAKASDIYRAWWLTTDKNLCKTAADLNGAKLKADVTDRAIVDTANEAGFQASKVGYVINGEPTSPFPLKWLGEAVAYWKSEAYAARRQRDEAKELADYHRNNLNDFQRKVELTLKPACPHLYEDTIGYVQWAADEIKSLRASLSVMTEDRDEYIDKLDEAKECNRKCNEAMSTLTSTINDVRLATPATCLDGHGPASWMRNAAKDLEALRVERDGLIHETKVAVAEAESLRADMAKCRLIHGVHQGDVWIAGNHEERIIENKTKDAGKYGDLRDGYAAYAGMMLGHMHVHEKPKAKRKPAKKKVNLKKASVAQLAKLMEKGKKKGGRK